MSSAKPSRILFIKSPIFWIVALAVVGIVFFSQRNRNAPTEVEVATVLLKKTSSVLVVSGNVEAIEEAVISSALATSQIRDIFVEKGDDVRIGQPVIQLVTTDLVPVRDRARASVQFARANLQRAIAQAAGAKSGLSLSTEANTEVIGLRTTRDSAKSQVLIAENRLKQTQISLKKVREGSRDEEVRLAKANVSSAESQLALKKKEYDRAKALLIEGIISQSSFDIKEEALNVAKSNLVVARQQLLIVSQPRAEDVKFAESQLAESRSSLSAAQIALRNSETALRLRLSQRTDKVNAATNLATAEADIAVARASLAQSDADLARAEADLKNATLRSPINGTVLETTAKKGESASPGVNLIKLTTADAFRIVANVEEKFLPFVRVGQTVKIATEALPNKTLTAEVTQILGSANVSTGTVPVILSLNESDPRIRAGLTLDVNIQTAPDSKSLIIPVTSLVRKGTKTSVFMIESGKAVVREVKIGRQSDDGLMVLSGLKEGDQVITNSSVVKEGQTVKVKKEKDQNK